MTALTARNDPAHENMRPANSSANCWGVCGPSMRKSVCGRCRRIWSCRCHYTGGGVGRAAYNQSESLGRALAGAPRSSLPGPLAAPGPQHAAAKSTRVRRRGEKNVRNAFKARRCARDGAR